MKTLSAVAAAALAALLFAPAHAGAASYGAVAAGEWSAPAGERTESERLRRAKDLMSDDRWVAAIPVLRAAAEDLSETDRDEALFWLAHSQNRAGDLAESVESIRRLQREHPKSRWTAPAYSLLIELAQKLGRDDVLWSTAVPPPPAPPAPPASWPEPPRTGRRPRPSVAAPPPPPPVTPQVAPAPPVPPPPSAWFPEEYFPDATLRVEALGRLIRVDPPRVIPLLRDIALEDASPAAARRAVFVLAQSRNPDAQTTVIDVARSGPPQVRLAAVRELARFGGERASDALLQVYATADVPVKQQVVMALADRADAAALMKIAQTEADRAIRENAVVALGRAGGREQLRTMYAKAPVRMRHAIIRGLFNARDEDGLIMIAEREPNARVRAEALTRLRLLGTPRAAAWLERSR